MFRACLRKCRLERVAKQFALFTLHSQDVHKPLNKLFYGESRKNVSMMQTEFTIANEAFDVVS